MARGLGDRVRDLLPESLRSLIGEVDDSPMMSSIDEVDCDDGADNEYNLSLEQIRLANLLRQYNQEHVNSMFDALEHIGIASDDEDPDIQLSDSDVDFIGTLLERYSEEDFERIIEQTPARAPRRTTSTAVLNELDQAVAQAMAGGGGGGQAGTEGGGASEASVNPPDISELREVQRRLATVDLDRAGRFPRAFPEGSWGEREVGDTFLQFVFWSEEGTLYGGFERVTITGRRDDGRYEVTLGGNFHYFAETGNTCWIRREAIDTVTLEETGD